MKIGGNDISAVTIGDTSVRKLMLGNEQVWPEVSLFDQFIEADLSGMSVGDTMKVIVNLPLMEAGKQWLCTDNAYAGLGFKYNTKDMFDAANDDNCVFTLEKTSTGFKLIPTDTVTYTTINWHQDTLTTGHTGESTIRAYTGTTSPIVNTFLFDDSEVKLKYGYWADYQGGWWREVHVKPYVYRYAGDPRYLRIGGNSGGAAGHQDIVIYKVPVDLPEKFTEADLSGMSIGDTVDVIVNAPENIAGCQWLTIDSGATYGLYYAYDSEDYATVMTVNECRFTLTKTASGFTLGDIGWPDIRYSGNLNEPIYATYSPVGQFTFDNGELKCICNVEDSGGTYSIQNCDYGSWGNGLPRTGPIITKVKLVILKCS